MSRPAWASTVVLAAALCLFVAYNFYGTSTHKEPANNMASEVGTTDIKSIDRPELEDRDTLQDSTLERDSQFAGTPAPQSQDPVQIKIALTRMISDLGLDREGSLARWVESIIDEERNQSKGDPELETRILDELTYLENSEISGALMDVECAASACKVALHNPSLRNARRASVDIVEATNSNELGFIYGAARASPENVDWWTVYLFRPAISAHLAPAD